MQSVDPATIHPDAQRSLHTPLLEQQSIQREPSMPTGPELVQALIPEAGDATPSFLGVDEAVRDLRKAIVQQLKEGSTDVRRATTPPHKRDTTELLDPSIGYMSDVAQPGGFRRFHVHGDSSQAQQSLLQLLLLPDHRAVSFAESFGDLQQDDDEGASLRQVSAKKHSSSFFTTVVVVAKCCFCACFLFMPNGFRLAGMIGGPLYLVVVYVFMLWGIYCLIQSRKANGSGRYQDLALVWGKNGQQFLHWIITMISFGFNCIWVAGIAANLGMLFPAWSSNARLFCFLPLVVLLSLLRHLKYFTGTNLMGLVISVATYVYILAYSITEIARRGSKPVMLFDTSDFNSLLWLGQCGYTFEIICTVLPIYEAAAHKESVFSIVVVVSATLIMFYILIGFVVYLAFGDETQPIALLNLPQGSAAGYIFPGLYALSGATTMPLNNFVIFLSYEPIIRWPSGYRTRKWLKNLGRLVVVSLIYTATWLGGAQLQNLLGLVGGVFGMLLALVAPCLLHLKLCKPVGCARFLDFMTIALGVLIMGISFYLSLSTWKA